MEKLLRFLKYIAFFLGFYALILCAYIHSQVFVINESESIFTNFFDVSTLLDKEALLAFLAITLLIVNCLLAFLIKYKYEFATRRQMIISVVARAVAFILSYVILNKLLDSLAGKIKNAGALAYIFIVLLGWLFILTLSIIAGLLKKSTKSCRPEYTPSDSPTSYSSTANGTDKGVSASADISPSGKIIVKRFSKNAYIERDAVHYEIYVNCFYDNHGLLRTVDNTTSYRVIVEQFSKENEKRFFGTTSNTLVGLGGKIVDVDGDWRYLKQGEGFYDSRRHYCVIRGNFI